MRILVVQETDWLSRGPHVQHHIFERLSLCGDEVHVIDFDIDLLDRTSRLFIKRMKSSFYSPRVKKNARITLYRSSYLKIPFFHRISALVGDFLNINRIIHKSRPDIIVNYAMSNGLIALFFAKTYRIPLIFHYIDILHELIPYKPLIFIGKFASRFLFQHSDQIFVHSLPHIQYVHQLAAPIAKTRILRTGITLENTYSTKEKVSFLKEMLGINENHFVLLFMGYLYNFAGLIEIINYYEDRGKSDDIHNKNFRPIFLILGDGGIYEDIKILIESKKITWVKLIGRVPFAELASYIEIADICLQSFEINEITKLAAPIKIYEYMAHKKPVLSTKLPGIFSELGDNSGVIFIDSQSELIEKIETYANQRELLNQTGQIGYNYVVNNLLWDRICHELRLKLLKILIKYRHEHQ